MRVNPCADDLNFREAVADIAEALGRSYEVEEQDPLLGNACVQQDLNSLDCRSTSRCRVDDQNLGLARGPLDLPSMGSSSSTHLSAMSSGILA